MRSNPFSPDIFPDGVTVTDESPQLHQEILNRLELLVTETGATETPEEGGGLITLLRAPRAGFGKSHLLARLRQRLGNQAFVLPFPGAADDALDWKSVLWALLGQFHAPSPERVPLSHLDVIARRVFARANARMIETGRVPCANPAEALDGLSRRYLDLYDFTDPAQPVARWFADHFERLLPAAAEFVTSSTGIADESARHWLRVLCGYAQGLGDGGPVRMETLRWAVQQPESAAQPSAGMMIVAAPTTNGGFFKDRVMEFLQVARLARPLVLVADHLDAMHGNAGAAMQVSTVLAEMRRCVQGLLVVLSMNQDLWAKTFQSALPSALEDRLTGQIITLDGVGREEAGEIIQTRLNHAQVDEAKAQAFLRQLNLAEYFAQESGRLVSPRALLRHASARWEKFLRLPAVPGPTPAMPNSQPPSASLTVADAPFFDPPAAAMTVPDALPPTQNGDSSFRKLREVLDRLLPSAREREPQSSGVILPDPPPGSRPAQTIIPTGPTPFISPHAPAPDHSLHVRFHTIRAHFTSAPWINLDHDRLFHLVRTAGQRLAVVAWREVAIPGLTGLTAGLWESRDGEILFGSEPYEDRTYWATLIDFARSRAAQGARCRLVLFSSALTPVNLGTWLRTDEIVNARGHYLDLQTLDHPSLASLYAAEELLREAERGALPTGIPETFAALSPQIDFLWKRLTRPLPA